LSRNFSIVWILGFAGFLVMANSWIVSIILPTIAIDFGLSVPQASIVITAYLLSFGLSPLFFGPLADRYGKFRVIVLSLSLFILTTALCSLDANFNTLAVFRILSGAFAGSVMPVSNALISDLFAQEERQLALGLFQGLSILGQGVSMTFGGIVASTLGWRSIFSFISLLGVISFILVLATGKNVQLSSVKNKIVFKNYLLLFQNSLHQRTYFIILIEGILIGGLFSYLGAFIVFTYNFDNLMTGIIMTTFGLSVALFGKIGDRLARKWGQKTTLLIGFMAGMVSNFLLLFWGNILFPVIASVIFLGLALIIIHPTMLIMVAEFSHDVRGAAMSMVACSYMVGSGLGTALGGYLLEKMGYQAIFFVYGLTCFVLMIIIKQWLRLPYVNRGLARNG